MIQNTSVFILELLFVRFCLFAFVLLRSLSKWGERKLLHLKSVHPNYPCTPVWEILAYSSVQFSRSAVSDCDVTDCSTLGFPVHHQLPQLAQTHVHWDSDSIQPSPPLSSSSPPAFNLSQHQGLFHWVGSSYWGPKYWSFSFSISPSNEYSGLISSRMDWLDLLAV